MQEEKAAVLLSRAAVEGFEGSGLQRGGRFSAGFFGLQVCRQGNVVSSSCSCRSGGIGALTKDWIDDESAVPTVYPAVRASH